MASLINRCVFVQYPGRHSQARSVEQTTGETQLAFMIETHIRQPHPVTIHRQPDNAHAFGETRSATEITSDAGVNTASL